MILYLQPEKAGDIPEFKLVDGVESTPEFKLVDGVEYAGSGNSLTKGDCSCKFQWSGNNHGIHDVMITCRQK
jgi:hypothetical protein